MRTAAARRTAHDLPPQAAGAAIDVDEVQSRPPVFAGWRRGAVPDVMLWLARRKRESETTRS